MSVDDLQDEQENEIYHLVNQYYQDWHKKDERDFIPGKSPVPVSGKVFDEKEMIYLTKAMLDFWLTDGEMCEEFSHKLRQVALKRYAVLCNSGSSANLLAISAVKKEGAKVLTPALGFPTTLAPIIQNQMMPVLIDVELETFVPSEEVVYDALTNHPGIHTVVLPHTLGNVAPILSFDPEIVRIYDCCLVGDTRIKTADGYKPIKDIQVGDYVLTRSGYREVLEVQMTGIKSVITNIGITGTPDHPVITSTGVVPLDSLNASDIIYTWNEKLSCIEERTIIDIQSLKKDNGESIFGTRMGDIHLSPSIGKFGWTTMVQSLKEWLFTIKMVIPSTTTQPTWNFLREVNIPNYTSPKSDWNKSTKTWQWLDPKPLNGIKVMKVGESTKGSGRIRGRIKRLTQKLVSFVKIHTRHTSLVDPNTAPISVNGERKEPVYNLFVEGSHEFFANNILVHNCDAMGSEYSLTPVTALGDMTTLSFYPAHHITTGEGGAVLTSEPRLKRKLESLRDWGRDCWCATGCDNTCNKRYQWDFPGLPPGYDHKYVYSEIGYNLKMLDLQAAVGIPQLDKLPGFQKIRQENFDYFFQQFKLWEEFFILPKATRYAKPNWFGLPLTLRDEVPFKRIELLRYLEAQKIGTRLVFGGNLTRQPAFRNAPFYQLGRLTNSDKITEDSFWIGVYPGITPPMREYVVECFEKFLGGF